MATVTVRGRAEAETEPDRVRLVFAVRAEAVAGAEALELVAERSAAAEEALDRFGELLLARRPAAVTLTPIWSESRELGGQTITGQVARRTVVVEARSAGPLGELLAAIVAVPGSAVEGTEWLVDPDNPVHRRLRAAAVVDARERAGDYAGAAELRLGALESIAEPEVRPGEPVWTAQKLSFRSADAAGAVLELRPEPVPVGVSVDVRYALLG
ncbi:MAG TPA: SIMPL domain-containing protein [Mycobacteriales bacterium]